MVRQTFENLKVKIMMLPLDPQKLGVKNRAIDVHLVFEPDPLVLPMAPLPEPMVVF